MTDTSELNSESKQEFQTLQMKSTESPCNGSASRDNDLAVDHLSESLAGRHIDVIVSGSIGAVESVKSIRSLRRLGATVTPWLTDGGAQFVTEMALTWAAAKQTKTQFEGLTSHLATGDGCLVAPASASFIGHLAAGITDSPATALATSYLGFGKPVFLLPNMHDSLYQAPQVQNNLETLKGWGIQIVPARLEEGKQKFPAPALVADFISYALNQLGPREALNDHEVPCDDTKKLPKKVLLTMGSTRGYIDDVRYLSNYSSGALGSAIASELYRAGLTPIVINGSSAIRPHKYIPVINVSTNDEMLREAQKALTAGASAAICAASVLDFEPRERRTGKLATKDHPALTLELKATDKIISYLNPSSAIKVGFKLEVELSEEKIKSISQDYMKKYGLSLLVLNQLDQVSETQHEAILCEREGPAGELSWQPVSGKLNLAQAIVRHVVGRLN